MTMPNPVVRKPIDFEKVELLRKSMLLTMADTAVVLGVSRLTYHKWVRGGEIRKGNLVNAKAGVRKLLALVSEKGWPTPDILAATGKQRTTKLLALLDQDN